MKRIAALEAREESLRLDAARLDREREALRGERSVSDCETVADVFAHRGLRGRDELDRAVEALAGVRALGDLLELVVPSDRGALLRFLEERLLLVGGTVPSGIGRLAAVTVAAERADVPGEEVLGRLVARVGEELMLSGLRRVLVVGGPAVWQRMIRERLDARIELRVLPGGPRTAAQARDDVEQSEVVVLWQVEEAEAARSIYDEGARVVVRVSESSPAVLFEQVVAALTC